jgi:hypothetical protein
MSKLQSSGLISLGNLADEYIVSKSNVSFNAFHKVAPGTSLGPVNGVVKSIANNAAVPASGQIRLSNFYGSGWYYKRVYFLLTSATVLSSTAGTYNSNGTIRVYVDGSSSNYTVSVTGRAGQTLSQNGFDGSVYAQFDGLAGDVAYTITVTDNLFGTTYTFTANISKGGTSTVTGYATTTWHNVG